VYRLSSRIWYTLIVLVLSFTTFGISVAFLVIGLPLTVTEFATTDMEWMLITSNCLLAIIDVGNTIAMCYWLFKAQKETTFRRFV